MSYSPDFLPVSYSVDAVHHYVLMDYLYKYDSLPDLNYSYYMQEMVQYPYGASSFTAFIAKISGIELIKTMQILIFAAAGLMAVVSYLIAGELMEDFKGISRYKDIIALVSPFMLFSVPIYFLGQYLSNSFYYSMIFGELMVMGTLLSLLKIEKGDIDWINVYFIFCLGLIFTYPLFLLIPVFSAVVWLFFNPDIKKTLNIKIVYAYSVILAALFLKFSMERFTTGKAILLNEGSTLMPDISRYNLLFIVLVVSGIILYVLEKEDRIKKIAVIYLIFFLIEPYVLIFLNQYGMIAKYFAYKIFYLQVLIMSPFTVIPIAYVMRSIDNYDIKNKRMFLFGIIFIIFLISLYFMTAYQINSKAVLSNDDIELSKYVAEYRFDNNLSDGDITIIAPNLASYWISNGFLHMEKDYAINKYLTYKKLTIEDWLNEPGSLFLITRTEFIDGNFFKKNVNVNFVIERRENNSVFLKKI